MFVIILFLVLLVFQGCDTKKIQSNDELTKKIELTYKKVPSDSLRFFAEKRDTLQLNMDKPEKVNRVEKAVILDSLIMVYSLNERSPFLFNSKGDFLKWIDLSKVLKRNGWSIFSHPIGGGLLGILKRNENRIVTYSIIDNKIRDKYELNQKGWVFNESDEAYDFFEPCGENRFYVFNNLIYNKLRFFLRYYDFNNEERVDLWPTSERILNRIRNRNEFQKIVHCKMEKRIYCCLSKGEKIHSWRGKEYLGHYEIKRDEKDEIKGIFSLSQRYLIIYKWIKKLNRMICYDMDMIDLKEKVYYSSITKKFDGRLVGAHDDGLIYARFFAAEKGKTEKCRLYLYFSHIRFSSKVSVR